MSGNVAKKIDEVLSRSIDTIYPNREALETLLKSGKKLRIYMGIDPTSTYVHLGHSTNYIVLKRFHDLGHKIIVLIGDFTAMIGDPSDKSAMRVQLTKKKVVENFKTYKEQIGKILDFNDKKNPIEFRFNSEWLSKLKFDDIVDLASNFTVQQMIDRDNFQRRIKENKPLYLHEFLYPLMQGYDSVALNVDVEVEGTDQTFNMLAGRTLVKAIQKREKLSVTTTLLENPITGEKLMSKSLGTGIALDDSSKDMYGKVMALPDEAIIQCFIDCTYLDMFAIKKLELELKSGANPRDVKARLAYEIVKIYHDEKTAEKECEAFNAQFRDKKIPDDIPEIKLSGNYELTLLLTELGAVSSNTEARRLIEQGAVKIDEAKITDLKAPIAVYKGMIIQVGKRNYWRIK